MKPHRAAAIDLSLLTIGTLLLLASGMLYVLYRPQTLLLFHVADSMGLLPLIDSWQQWASAWPLHPFVVYSLPAGLWALSYVLIAVVLAAPLPPKGRLAAVAAVPLLGTASELMQAAGLLPGTFDWADLALYLAPLTLLTIINKQ